jgi:ATP-dependent Zn protease
MVLPEFSKIYKPRKFNYQPVYYDPKKEARKEREEKYVENKSNNNKEFRTSIRKGSFREELERRGGYYEELEEKTKNNSSRFDSGQLIAIFVTFFLLFLILVGFVYFVKYW